MTIRERLAAAVIEGDEEGIVALIESALDEGLSPLEISNEGLLPGLEEVDFHPPEEIGAAVGPEEGQLGPESGERRQSCQRNSRDEKK